MRSDRLYSPRERLRTLIGGLLLPGALLGFGAFVAELPDSPTFAHRTLTFGVAILLARLPFRLLPRRRMDVVPPVLIDLRFAEHRHAERLVPLYAAFVLVGGPALLALLPAATGALAYALVMGLLDPFGGAQLVAVIATLAAMRAASASARDLLRATVRPLSIP